MSPPSTYKAAVFTEANAPAKIQDVTYKKPGPGEVVVKVIACGVCFSDHGVQGGHMGPVFPRVPGHELVGNVIAVGPEVSNFSEGQRVGGPWHGGHDRTCKACQKSLFQMCDNKAVNGVSRDGGYAQYVTLRAEAAVRVPEDMDPAQVAPLLCAGVTVFNGIRKLKAEAGGILAVQGLGGLGHLAVQYASKMGFHVVAISSGSSKRDFAAKLGASDYIDTSSEDAAAKLQEMGGADVIVATAPNGQSIGPLSNGLAPEGKLLILAVAGPIEVDSMTLVTKGVSVHGWPSGHALDSEEAIKFAKEKGIECMIEKYSLDQVNEALDNMVAGKARFRNVLVME